MLMSLDAQPPVKKGGIPKKYIDCKDKAAKIKAVKKKIQSALSQIFEEIDDEELVQEAKLLFLKGMNDSYFWSKALK
jgi:hypothetical protein